MQSRSSSFQAVQNYLAIRRDPIGFLSNIVREQGDFARFKLLTFPYVLVNEPALIREALVNQSDALIIRGGTSAGLARLIGHGILTNRGQEWQASRKALQPLFHGSAFEQYIRTIEVRVDESLARWRGQAPGTSVDIQHELLALSFRVMCSTLFRWLPTFDDASTFAAAMRILQTDGMNRYFMGGDLMPWWPSSRNRRIAGACSALRDLARSAATHATGLSVDEIRSLLFAGTESPVNTVCFALVLLEDHPEWLDRIRGTDRSGEADRDGTPSAATDALTQVLCESLRLFPAGWAFERFATRDADLGGRPIRRGERLLFSPFLLHRNAGLWKDPERFDPTRFAADPGGNGAMHRQGYLPFGAGPRSCIGSRLALAEMRIVLNALARRCRWKTVRDADEQPLTAEGSFKIRLSRPHCIQLEVIQAASRSP